MTPSEAMRETPSSAVGGNEPKMFPPTGTDWIDNMRGDYEKRIAALTAERDRYRKALAERDCLTDRYKAALEKVVDAYGKWISAMLSGDISRKRDALSDAIFDAEDTLKQD
jgi:hypothetical protein